MHGMRKWPWLIVGALAVAGFTCSEPQVRSFGTPSTVVMLQGGLVDESSGIAPSHVEPDHYWTHNDDGETLELFKFSLDGKVGKVNVPGVVNRDCEDMASAVIGGKPYLFIADIGDNAARWPSVRITRVEEPKNDVAAVSNVTSYTLTYPNGARNAEGFFVDPASGDMWIVEKTSAGPAGIYVARNPKPGANTTMERVGQISVGGAIQGSRLVTGAALSPDRKYVVVRTYLAANEYPTGGKLDGWWNATPVNVKTNLEAQGEAITYSKDGSKLYTTSEGNPCQVSVIPVK